MSRVDDKIILNYCDSKGVDTTGMTAFDALVLQLETENPGRQHHFVSKARTASIIAIKPDEVVIPNIHHYDRVESRIPSGIKYSIAGIVYKDNRDQYVLIDGYHRLKHLKTSSGSQHPVIYILLSGE